jgi:diguanylate cyclase (GGDEF)-like protein
MVAELDDQQDGETDVDVFKPRPSASEVLSVTVVSGPDAGRFFELPSVGGVIGRHPNAPVRLADRAVSRRHAAIARTPEGWMLRDLGSCNGVFVSGERVREHALADGDRVQISARTVLRVRFHEPAETRMIEEMQRAAASDALTGLPNRRYLMGRLVQEMSYARRHGARLSVMMTDLDDFKPVNDRHGHEAGDDVLRTVASRLERAVRAEDVVARYGGDEFVVLARGFPGYSAQQFAERLERAIGGEPIAVAGAVATLTLSIGVAEYPDRHEGPGSTESPERLLARADAALYAVKRRGKRGVALWSGATEAPDAAPASAATQEIAVPTLHAGDDTLDFDD